MAELSGRLFHGLFVFLPSSSLTVVCTDDSISQAVLGKGCLSRVPASTRATTVSHPKQNKLPLPSSNKTSLLNAFSLSLPSAPLSPQDQKGQIHQVWYDDPQSICPKADYVRSKGLRGIGMWNGNILDYSDEPVARQQTAMMWNALLGC